MCCHMFEDMNSNLFLWAQNIFYHLPFLDSAITCAKKHFRKRKFFEEIFN